MSNIHVRGIVLFLCSSSDELSETERDGIGRCKTYHIKMLIYMLVFLDEKCDLTCLKHLS